MKVFAYLVPALAVFLLFAALWWLDSRRARRQAHDPQRRDVRPGPHSDDHDAQRGGPHGPDETYL